MLKETQIFEVVLDIMMTGTSEQTFSFDIKIILRNNYGDSSSKMWFQPKFASI